MYIGVDIGGTFTDFTVYDSRSGKIYLEKVLSTPESPQSGVLSGIDALAKRIDGLFANCSRFNHATTLVTNSIIERKGPKIALITTAGFRDVIEMRRELRYNLYELSLLFPEPIVKRSLRFGVEERMMSDGSVRVPLDEHAVRALAVELRDQGIEAVAICFLHAYRNPAHETRAAEIVREVLPNAAISLSHDVSPEPREYDRFSTTVLDAFVKPVVDTYLALLLRELRGRGIGAELEIMLSNGGSTTTDTARNYPIQLIESGPAAGVEAAIWVCKRMGIVDALSFDMGGTTAKLCVIQNSAATRARKFEAARVNRFVAGSGMPVSVPVYDLVEIGAGGGSIARVDKLGLIEVGPDSAGASPGPASYGLGGTNPTVTDADLLLGLIDPNAFLGGEMQLSTEAAESAMLNCIGTPLGLSAVEAAYGVFNIVNETMAAAARLHIAEKGSDPTKLAVIAFGGAGPLHALEVSRKLGSPRVVFPPLAGVMSSFGLLTGASAFERMRNIKRLLADLTLSELTAAVGNLEDEIWEVLKGDRGSIEFHYVAEMWYRGQDYPIDVPFDRSDLVDPAFPSIAGRFRERYLQLYGRGDDEMPLELTAIRVIGKRVGDGIESVDLGAAEATGRKGMRRVYDPQSKTFIEIPVYERSSLRTGVELAGPLCVQERETGIVIGRGDRLTVDASGALIIEIGKDD